ncbi:unnamed protein product, partial [Discosporangium mesarthrocarpum]
MGGLVNVKSILGKGSTFSVPVVIIADTEPTSATSVVVAMVISKKREERDIQLHILLAEDSIPYQKLMAGILQVHGCAVGVAGDGQEAINRLSSGQFDLLITDRECP